jgi:hypothetical protein
VTPALNEFKLQAPKPQASHADLTPPPLLRRPQMRCQTEIQPAAGNVQDSGDDSARLAGAAAGAAGAAGAALATAARFVEVAVPGTHQELAGAQQEQQLQQDNPSPAAVPAGRTLQETDVNHLSDAKCGDLLYFTGTGGLVFFRATQEDPHVLTVSKSDDVFGCVLPGAAVEVISWDAAYWPAEVETQWGVALPPDVRTFGGSRAWGKIHCGAVWHFSVGTDEYSDDYGMLVTISLAAKASTRKHKLNGRYQMSHQLWDSDAIWIVAGQRPGFSFLHTVYMFLKRLKRFCMRARMSVHEKRPTPWKLLFVVGCLHYVCTYLVLTETRHYTTSFPLRQCPMRANVKCGGMIQVSSR